MMLNRLKAKGFVKEHIDPINRGERWHLPLTTNVETIWWDELEGTFHMRAGLWWGPVPYKVLHSVRNDGSTDRIHLVVDVLR